MGRRSKRVIASAEGKERGLSHFKAAHMNIGSVGENREGIFPIAWGNGQENSRLLRVTHSRHLGVKNRDIPDTLG